MFATPELVITERIELFDQIEIAAELQHRVLADRMVRGEEGTEFKASQFKARHGQFSWAFLREILLEFLDAKLWGEKDQGNRDAAHTRHASPRSEPPICSPRITSRGFFFDRIYSALPFG
jgi:hypothetical protein